MVHRMFSGVEGAGFSKVAVAPFQQDGGEWPALLPGDLQGVIQSIQGQPGG